MKQVVLTVLCMMTLLNAAEKSASLDSVSKKMTQEEIRIANDAVSYMNQLFAPINDLQQISYYYLRSIVQMNGVKSSERKRAELIEGIKVARKFSNEFHAFNGDSTLITALFKYLDLTYLIFKEDYDKILDMDNIREQSIDDEEAYEIAVDKANEKHDAIFRSFEITDSLFAAKYKVPIDTVKSAMSIKIDNANRLLDYYSKIQRSVTRPHRYYGQAMGAQDEKNLALMEQNLISLRTYSDASLEKLKGQESFNGDSSLISAASNYISQLKTVGEQTIRANIDFILQAESFEKMSKKMMALDPQKRTAEEVETYNAEVSHYNKSIKEINSLNKTNYSMIDAAFKQWEKSIDTFLNGAM